MKYRYFTTVVGTMSFPIDMLRYDRVTPATQEDAAMISLSISTRDDYRVQVVGEREPTKERWRTFGWNVTEVRKETV